MAHVRPSGLDDHRGGLDHGDGEGARLQAELAHRLRRHQRDHAVRTGLDVDLRHDAVELHPCDESDEAVARAREYVGRVARRRGELDGSGGECFSGDLDGRCPGRRQRARIDPPADRVVAHREQPRRLGDLVAGHSATLSPHLRVVREVFAANADVELVLRRCRRAGPSRPATPASVAAPHPPQRSHALGGHNTPPHRCRSHNSRHPSLSRTRSGVTTRCNAGAEATVGDTRTATHAGESPR